MNFELCGGPRVIPRKGGKITGGLVVAPVCIFPRAAGRASIHMLGCIKATPTLRRGWGHSYPSLLEGQLLLYWTCTLVFVQSNEVMTSKAKFIAMLVIVSPLRGFRHLGGDYDHHYQEKQ